MYKHRGLARWVKKNQVTDDALAKAVAEIEKGLISADLGGGLIKQRVATKGRGKRGSSRVILTVRLANRAVFLHGFEKTSEITSQAAFINA